MQSLPPRRITQRRAAAQHGTARRRRMEVLRFPFGDDANLFRLFPPWMAPTVPPSLARRRTLATKTTTAPWRRASRSRSSRQTCPVRVEARRCRSTPSTSSSSLRKRRRRRRRSNIPPVPPQRGPSCPPVMPPPRAPGPLPAAAAHTAASRGRRARQGCSRRRAAYGRWCRIRSSCQGQGRPATRRRSSVHRRRQRRRCRHRSRHCTRCQWRGRTRPIQL